jgi:hypothetical protein
LRAAAVPALLDADGDVRAPSALNPDASDAGLLREPADFRRQVIVGELLHLKVPNHGRVFRALLRAYLGEAAAQRGDLTTRPVRANGSATIPG